MKYFILTGEPSGDLHASALVKNIKNNHPEAIFFGVGGSNLEAEGVELIYNIKDLSFMGFWEVIKNISKIQKIKKDIINFILSNKIKNIIFVDYPGLNLNIAKSLKKYNINTFYFILPQIWAWHESRVEIIKNNINHIISILPFEVDFYKKHGLNAIYEGHPLVDRLNEYNYLTKQELFEKYKLDPEKEVLLLLPGSREQEINYLFNDMLISANKISVEHNLQIVVASAQNISKEIFNNDLKIKYTIVDNNVYDFFKYAKFGIIKSGTSTLEAALHQLPFIVVYKTNKFNYLLGKRLIKVNYISLVNLIANKPVVTELIQNEVNIPSIFNSVNYYLNNNINLINLQNELLKIKQSLGDIGVIDRIANYVLKNSL
ncbi:MAG TPA: lipid-A-disaccharide synthase [Ignavibacteriales bacterium]|nr:lipid-A-disaccharide synthase [Ignavibacteriales bacterium]